MNRFVSCIEEFTRQALSDRQIAECAYLHLCNQRKLSARLHLGSLHRDIGSALRVTYALSFGFDDKLAPVLPRGHVNKDGIREIRNMKFEVNSPQ